MCCLSVSVLNPVLCSKKQIAQLQIKKGSSFDTLLDVNKHIFDTFQVHLFCLVSDLANAPSVKFHLY